MEFVGEFSNTPIPHPLSLRMSWAQSYFKNCLGWKTHSRLALYIFGSSIVKSLREAHTHLKAVKWWLMRHLHDERAPFHYFGNNLLSPKHQKPGHFVILDPLIFFASGGMGGISRLSDSRDLPRARWKALILSGGQRAACLLIPSGGFSLHTHMLPVKDNIWSGVYIRQKQWVGRCCLLLGTPGGDICFISSHIW